MAGDHGNKKLMWEHWQLEFLRNNWKNMNARQLSAALSLSLNSVRRKKYELGYLSMQQEYWTKEQVVFLRSNYEKYGDTELTEMFSALWSKKKGWSKKQIEKKRKYLRLKRSADQKKAIYERNKTLGCWAKNGEKIWKKRGVAPEGSLKIFFANGRVNQYIKVNGKYVPHARHLYEQLHGEVPKDCVVRLKDGNPYNVTPENLELTRRSLHAVRNSRSRHDPEQKRPQIKAKIKYIITLTDKVQKDYEKQTKRLEQLFVCSA